MNNFSDEGWFVKTNGLTRQEIGPFATYDEAYDEADEIFGYPEDGIPEIFVKCPKDSPLYQEFLYKNSPFIKNNITFLNGKLRKLVEMQDNVEKQIFEVQKELNKLK